MDMYKALPNCQTVSCSWVTGLLVVLSRPVPLQYQNLWTQNDPNGMDPEIVSKRAEDFPSAKDSFSASCTLAFQSPPATSTFPAPFPSNSSTICSKTLVAMSCMSLCLLGYMQNLHKSSRFGMIHLNMAGYVSIIIEVPSVVSPRWFPGSAFCRSPKEHDRTWSWLTSTWPVGNCRQGTQTKSLCGEPLWRILNFWQFVKWT